MCGPQKKKVTRNPDKFEGDPKTAVAPISGAINVETNTIENKIDNELP